MRLYVVFGQRKELYEGEFGPEALEVADEFTMDENPDWLYGKLETLKQKGEFQAVEIIEVILPSGAQEEIRRKLIGTLEVHGSLEARGAITGEANRE